MLCSERRVADGGLDGMLQDWLQSVSVTSPGGSGAGTAGRLRAADIAPDPQEQILALVPHSLCRILFSSSEDNHPLLEHFFSPWSLGEAAMDSFLIHYIRIHSTHCHARTHKVRACSFKEKSLEITQAEFKVEIQQHKEFEDSGICFYPELQIEVESNRHYRIFHFTAWKKKFTQCEVFCIPEYCSWEPRHSMPLRALGYGRVMWRGSRVQTKAVHPKVFLLMGRMQPPRKCCCLSCHSTQLISLPFSRWIFLTSSRRWSVKVGRAGLCLQSRPAAWGCTSSSMQRHNAWLDFCRRATTTTAPRG